MAGPGPTPTPMPTPTPTPVPAQHLYLVNANGNGQILQFGLPLTSSSQPSAMLSSSGAITTVAVDSAGNLAISSSTGQLTIYTAPITNSSVPAATFNNGTATSTGQLGFDSSGNLFASTNSTNSPPDSNHVNIFSPPFSSSTVPSQVITVVPIPLPGGDSVLLGALTVDGNGNMYVVDNGDQAVGPILRMFAPPYTGSPTVIAAGGTRCQEARLASNNTLLFATFTCNEVPPEIECFCGSACTNFALIDQFGPGSLAADAQGNLYVADGDLMLRVYAAPINSSSTPILTLNVGASQGYDIAIGK